MVTENEKIMQIQMDMGIKYMKEADDLRALIRELEWSGHGQHEYCCPYCDCPKRSKEHSAECKIRIALKEPYVP